MSVGRGLSRIRRMGAGLPGLLAVVAVAMSAANAQDIGFEGPRSTGAGATPTESKPESKLWFNDGIWWGCLWSSSAQAFRIHRLNFTTHAWTDTGVAIESRPNSHSDALWDGRKLYVASHEFSSTGGSSGNPILVFRYSYDSTTDAYGLEPGFPVTISDFSTEALVLAKDSTGVVWASWTQGRRVQIGHTLASDTQWSPSTVLPNTTQIDVDDLCSITSYGGNRIGVMWSDQRVNAYRFSFHVDGAADTAWSAVENATTGETDDHLNLAAHSDGRVFAVGKNAANNLLLLVRATNGSWSRFVVTQPSPILTRPIVLLNEPGNLIHVFATGQDTGEIFEKTSPISSISFAAGTGTIRMRDASTVFRISNPTSTKQNVDSSTGLVVLAHHDTTGFYWHHDVAPIVTAPVAGFTAAPTSGPAPLVVAFADTSTGSVTSRSWSFGDGGTSTATDPVHTYATPGTYTVSLTVTGPGGSDTETRADLIVASPPGPVAAFGASPTSGGVPLRVSFTDASTGAVTARSWSFGDGHTSRATNPKHTYRAAGTYTVSLTVTGPGGSDTETKSDYIIASAQVPPVADFSATPTSGLVPLQVAFTDVSTGAVTSRSWSFGDGGTSTATNPGHIYSAAGTYTVSLTVTGPDGSDAETKTDLIAVSTAPVAAFDAAPTSGPAPLSVAFTDLSSGGPSSWSWDFGDGETSSARSPTHLYTAPGTYSVTLVASNAAGSSSITKTDLVSVQPTSLLHTYVPAADARVNEGYPSSNYGTATELRVRFEAGGSYHSYLRFDLTGLVGTVTSAKLRLFCTDGSPVGGLFFLTSNAWDETGITWANKPAANGGQIASLGTVATGTWIEVDVTSAVPGQGQFSFLMTSTSSNSALYSSREGSNPPELVVTTAGP